MAESRSEVVTVELPNGKKICVEATLLGGEEPVSFHDFRFEEVLGAVEGIAQGIAESLGKVKPRKASVELGLEVGLESGKLTTLLVKGTGTANLKLTLEWGGE
ncbi:MAG: CU044_2847 family protein [Isosphaeraceae bacterium]